MKIYALSRSALKLYKNTKELVATYLNNNKFPEDKEFFKFTINSGNDASFAIPVNNKFAKKEDDSISYSWIIDWGDGTTEESSGEAGSGDSPFGDGKTKTIPHIYAEANKNYQITIKPKNPNELGWGKGFGFGYSKNANTYHTRLISLDSHITKNMWFDNGNNDCLGAFAFMRCSKLTMSNTFQLPQDISSVGHSFGYCMFALCSSLTMNNIFNLPQNIILNNDLFCASMFTGCTSLTMNDVFQLPQNLTSINGSETFAGMFSGCTSLTMNDIFQLPQNLTSINHWWICNEMFAGCTNLRLNNIFKLPQNLASIYNGFCSGMFNGCTSLTTGIKNFFGKLYLPKSELDKEQVFTNCFINCLSITEEISADTIPQLSVIPTNNNECFTGCPADKIANCPDKWGGNLVQSTKTLYGWKPKVQQLDNVKLNNVYTDTTKPNENSVLYNSDGSKSTYSFSGNVWITNMTSINLKVIYDAPVKYCKFDRDSSLDKTMTGYFTN